MFGFQDYSFRRGVKTIEKDNRELLEINKVVELAEKTYDKFLKLETLEFSKLRVGRLPENSIKRWQTHALEPVENFAEPSSLFLPPNWAPVDDFVDIGGFELSSVEATERAREDRQLAADKDIILAEQKLAEAENERVRQQLKKSKEAQAEKLHWVFIKMGAEDSRMLSQAVLRAWFFIAVESRSKRNFLSAQNDLKISADCQRQKVRKAALLLGGNIDKALKEACFYAWKSDLRDARTAREHETKLRVTLDTAELDKEKSLAKSVMLLGLRERDSYLAICFHSWRRLVFGTKEDLLRRVAAQRENQILQEQKLNRAADWQNLDKKLFHVGGKFARRADILLSANLFSAWKAFVHSEKLEQLKRETLKSVDELQVQHARGVALMMLAKDQHSILAGLFHAWRRTAISARPARTGPSNAPVESRRLERLGDAADVLAETLARFAVTSTVVSEWRAEVFRCKLARGAQPPVAGAKLDPVNLAIPEPAQEAPEVSALGKSREEYSQQAPNRPSFAGPSKEPENAPKNSIPGPQPDNQIKSREPENTPETTISKDNSGCFNCFSAGS